MPLVDHNILFQQQGANPVQAVGQGVQLQGLLRQNQQASREEAFRQAFVQAAQGQDLMSEDGLRNTLKQTAQQFPEESLSVFQKWQEKMPKAAKPAPKQFHAFGDKAVTFDPSTGQAAEIPGMTKPAENKPKSYQHVKNKQGQIVAWDPETGMGLDGKPVEAWQEPKAPKENGLTPYQAAHLKFMEGKEGRERTEKLNNRIASYRKETDDSRRSAVALNSVDSSLKSMGLKDGIYGGGEGIEGYGVGGKLFRNLPRGPSLAKLRSAVAELTIAYRKENFGTAQSKQELKAMEEFTGQGTISDEASFLAGLQRIRDATDQKLRPESPELEEALAKQKLLTHRDLPKPAAPKADPKSITKPEEEDEYQAWKKAQGR